MKKILCIKIFILGFVSLNAQNINTEMEKVSYSLGVNIASSLKQQGWELDAKSLSDAFVDVFNGNKLLIDEKEASSILQNYQQKIANKTLEKNSTLGKEFLEKNAKKDGVITTSSGLQYKVLKEGDGESPKETDKVEVHYHGTLIDGTVFDSSVDRGESITFPVNGVIPGWVEALQLMKTGAKYKLFIPSELAYGNRGQGKIGPNSTLIFEVELIAIK
ncbi:MAG: peptidylprolyl isomerase [Flavobacteriales bacterium]|nr:peptidylprolyl isomerase [Flavobacteriales bacterium]